MRDNHYIIGCDVGTGSVRAGVFTEKGKMMAMATRNIKVWRPQPDFVEQSSDDIWQACCNSVREAVKEAEVNPDHIKGIGFDATCSLVVLGENDTPVTVSPTNSSEHNIIVWMDHRAQKEAEQINQTEHEVLRYVGGTISPEMETPKLLWLKRNMPETWEKAAKFLDLADFMVYRATGNDDRSSCTATCKWTYLAHEQRWEDSYFDSIGLEDLVEENYRRIGQIVQPVGTAIGHGLTARASDEMQLRKGTAVSAGIIDAHAGGLGLLGMSVDDAPAPEFSIENCLALIGGTSSCHMAVSQTPKFIDGVWGPYHSAMIPDMWLTEGGQSATGSLIDHIIFSSNQADSLKDQARRQHSSVYQLLNERLYAMKEETNRADVGMLTENLHLLPYFHGNRSPRADASLTGMISGLTLSNTMDDLALVYLAAIQAIACGTRHIIETLNKNGYSIDKIMATGGGTKNELFLKTHADVCGCSFVLPQESEAVLLGSAVLGAVAAGAYATVVEAMDVMNQTGHIVQPVGEPVKSYYDAKYRVFHKMYHDQKSYLQMMEKKNKKNNINLNRLRAE